MRMAPFFGVAGRVQLSIEAIGSPTAIDGMLQRTEKHRANVLGKIIGLRSCLVLTDKDRWIDDGEIEN